MTFQSALEPIYSPFIATGHRLREYSVATYQAFTSNTAKDIYKTTWILIQVSFWISVLAGLYTIKMGRQFKAYYDAEWSRDVDRLVRWIATYPERCLDTECALTDEPPIADTTMTAETIARQDDSPTATRSDVAAVAPETSILTVPEALQSILKSDTSKTNKLRKLASYYHIHWRNTRGTGKHMKNADLTVALQDLCPEILAALNTH